MADDVFVFPMSSAQERLWFLAQLDPDSVSYNLPAALSLRGALDVELVQRCANELVNRHEALRTTFEMIDGKPCQLVHATPSTLLTSTDLSVVPAGERDGELQRVVAREVRRPFDLTRGPLLRHTLVRLEAEHHVLLWVVHHGVFDGWSTSVVLREFAALYRAFRAGKESPLPALTLQYADFADWEQQRVARGVLTKQLDYWRAQLPEEQAPLELPFDRPRPAQQGFRGARYFFSVSPRLTAELRSLAQRRETTLYALLLAVYKVLLARYTGHADIRVGTPVTNRSRAELEAIVGCFANTVVLRSDLDGDPPFADVLARVQGAVRDAEMNRDVPFDQVVEALRPLRDPSRAPLCQVFFALQPELGKAPEIPGLTMRLLDLESGGSQLDLALELALEAEGINAALEYDIDLFDARSIERLSRHWLRLLQAVVVRPEARISALAMLDEDEHTNLLALSRTASSLHRSCKAGPRPPHRLFEAHAERDPAKLAVLHEGCRMSYGELQRRVDRLARRLMRHGVGPEVRVAICLPRSIEMIVAVLAVLKSGGAYVPVDPRYPAERVEEMLRDADARVAVVEDAVRAVIPRGTTILSTFDPPDEPEAATLVVADPHPQQAAYVLFTSGSTGAPKGVVIPHGSFASFIETAAELYAITEHDRVLQFAALSFDASVEEIFPCLARGATLVLRSEEMLESVATFLGACEAQDVTALELPTMYFHRVVAALSEGLSLPPSFRLLLIGGEAALPEFVTKWRSLPGAQRVRLLNTYGPAEATVTATECDLQGPAPCEGWAVSIGRPLANTTVYVLDGAGQTLPQGAVGELYLGGDSLARGYFGLPGLTAQRFVPNPFASTPGERLYRTGDRVRYRPDGQLEFLGRVDHQVKLRGFRIEPGEIEARLVALAGVREAIVVLHHDGPHQRRLIAYVAASGVTSETLRNALKEQLPDYMVPSNFVILSELPHNAHGKIDRRALPIPATERSGASAAPGNSVEAVLVAIWAHALGRPAVGIHDNFFELGGESILALQVVSRARAAGLTITARQLFLHQTVAALAKVAVPARGGDVSGVAAGEVPLTPIQRWFFEQTVPRRNHWNQSVLLKLRELVVPSLLEGALADVVKHHDTFRLRFALEAERWSQRYIDSEPAVPSSALRVVCVDVSSLSPAERTATIARVGAEWQTRLDLQRGPLLAAVLFQEASALQEGAGEGRLLLLAHHLIVDGVSWRIMLEDLQTAYRQRFASDPVRLPETTLSFGSWARQLAARAEHHAFLENAAYLPSCTRPALRPDDVSGDDTESATVQTVQELGPELTRQLHPAAQAYRMRLDELLIAALALAVGELGGSDAVRLDLEGHGRDALPDLDVSRTLGWFTRVHAVQLELSARGQALDTTLKSIKEALRCAASGATDQGLRRHFCATAERTEAARTPEISFNYLGQWDEVLSDTSLFALADEHVGPERDPKATRGYELEVDAALVRERLRVTWSFSGDRFRAATMERLQGLFTDKLERLVVHCMQSDITGATPSDFPLATLDQAGLDRVLGQAQNAQDIYPLSALQQGLLFHSLWEPGSGAYVEQVLCRLEGPLDAGAFRAAWQQVVARHDVLRTTFAAEGASEPLQVVRRTGELELRVEDWRLLSPEARAEAQAEQLAADRARGFDLSAGPLLRLAVYRVAEDTQVVLLSHHHLILDGWSAAIVLRDAFVAYDAMRRGELATLPMGPSYREYIAWLRQHDLRAAEALFRRLLAGFSSATELPFTRPKRADERSAAAAPRGYGVESVTLSAAFTARLEAHARRQHLTLNTLVTAAWAFVLGRTSGSDDVVFGTTTSGRSAPLAGIDGMVGLLINTLPLRVSLPAATPVGDWLTQLFERISELGPHEHTPLSEVQAWSEVPRGQPLFESLLVFENYPADAQVREGLPGLSVSEISFADQTNYPLTLSVLPAAELSLRLSFERERFDRADAVRLLAMVHGALKKLLEDPTQRLGQLSLLGQLESAQLVAACCGELVVRDAEPFVHVRFERAAAAFPDQTAVIFEGQRVSYGELNRRANQLAHALRRRGAGPDQLVAIAAERSVELVVGLLGIMKSGAAYLPIDPDYPPARVAFMLEDAAAPILVSQWPVASRLPAHAADLLCLDADRALIERESTENPNVVLHPSGLAYTIFTSGSTGQPKAAGNTHAGLRNRLTWMQAQYGLTASDRVLQKTPFSFDVSVWEFFWPLMTGATLVVAKPGDHRDSEQLWKLVKQHSVTTLHFVPPMLDAFLACEDRQRSSSLRRVICSGEALPAELARRCFERLDVELHNLYGPTEAAIDVTAWTCQPQDNAASVPIGRPIASTQVYVLDRCGQLVPPGVPGELHLGGIGLARGYHRRPGLTAERFVPDPFASTPGARLYRTGDLVRLRPDGAIDFLGRLDHQVKIRGLRVELGEIEARLLDHPGMREAVVVARAEAHGGKRLIAYVSGDALPEPEQLRDWVGRSLPAYMVPALILVLGRLPLSRNGKVDRRALPEPGALAAAARPYVPPRTEAERLLAAVWAEVLHVERVGIEDDFFALGGDSIVTLQVLARAAQRGLKLTPKLVFEHPTIAALAPHAEVSAEETSPAAVETAEMTSALSHEEWSNLLDELDR